MPTGYTQKLCESGQAFEEFAMTCARNFGALIMMREDPLDAPIPRFQPSDYSKKAGAEAEAKLERLTAMTPKQRRAFGAQCKRSALKSARDWLKRDMKENKRLNGMRATVHAWKPPTENHEGLKKFMLEQINTSTHDLVYIHRQIEEINATGALEYFNQAVETAKRDIEYHAQHFKGEVERTDQRNEWVDQLRASLKTSKSHV